MKTKEEIIQEAYGQYWDNIKDHVNMKHGSLDVHFWTLYEIKIPFDRIGFGDRRPESLKGIHDNNGWTVLNAETYENLENSYYMWYNQDNGDWEIDDLSETHIRNYTHFQEIKA
jgi:hypothetical protein